MQKADYPQISIYRHHFMAILSSENNAELTAVGFSIAATVLADHKELTYLVRAGQERRKELEESKEAK